MSEARQGILAMLVACLIWGLVPLFYKQLDHIPPIEILAHRTIWSAVIFVGVLLFQGRLKLLGEALLSRRMVLVIAAAAFLISFNWYFFIWAVSNDKATEASLGYFLFPLVAVFLGRLVFREQLQALQWVSIGMALFAVVLLTAGLGVAPWIALALSTSFGLYGLIKKGLSIGPVVSVTAEVIVLVPIAAVILWFAHGGGQGAFGADMQDSLLLVLSGALTATPLILFSFATKRVALSTVGLVQYLNPTLQFFCAVVIFGEPFGLWHGIAFPLIWIALALYSFAALRQEKAASKVDSSVARSSIT